MTVTNSDSGTNIQPVAENIWRINTPVTLPDGGEFSFNQYLISADKPLLFHTGPLGLFSMVRDAVRHVIAPEALRYIAFSHFEADECGSLNQWLEVAPESQPVCSAIGAMTSIGDIAIRRPRGMGDGEALNLGNATVEWITAPHVPHGWDNGFLFERSTGTLLCGDLFTQPGRGDVALTTDDILGPSEAFRAVMDYYSHSPDTDAVLNRLAALEPRVLACMHGSAWRGDGGAKLKDLAAALEQ
ncbi:MBL fold metallo-hydrolase [Croceicoccus bisphenolivorans]|uniref:MBL fold metallo-hydrolase n=1 Tax=Croceicoccus bisphenolivorans TaxID=1783232 RepID=UPI0008340D86|nr:MBL fold metallo-hydrolase [Croceicoccus bisphenolivorans]